MKVAFRETARILVAIILFFFAARSVFAQSGWFGQNPPPSGTTNWLGAVWGSGESDVWAVGGGGTILERRQ